MNITDTYEVKHKYKCNSYQTLQLKIIINTPYSPQPTLKTDQTRNLGNIVNIQTWKAQILHCNE